MRQLLFQETLNRSQNKRSLSLQENFARGGFSYSALRKTIFRVKQLDTFNTPHEANAWVSNRVNDPDEYRKFTLLKVSDTKRGRNTWQSRLSGIIYIVHNDIVLSLLYLQLFRVDVQINNIK